jgi:hypothetical protein
VRSIVEADLLNVIAGYLVGLLLFRELLNSKFGPETITPKNIFCFTQYLHTNFEAVTNKRPQDLSSAYFPVNCPLTLSDPTSNLVRQYDLPVPLRCRKTSDTVFVAFVRPLSEPVRRFSSCSTDFSQQIAQVVLFLFLQVFLF